MNELVEYLRRLDLLKSAAPLSPPHHLGEADLLQLCNAGFLDGGLTVALDVQPDELIGPLAATAGGRARLLKVTEVRVKPAEMILSLENTDHRCGINGLGELVDQFNELFESDRSVKAVAVLGEWDEALQLWCLRKQLLADLSRQSFFSPLNLPQLRTLAQKVTLP